MGFNDTKMVASNLFKKAASEWGCSASTLHGRTRAQRYTRAADYDYIRQAVEELREYEVVHDLARMPIIGNGDVSIFCYLPFERFRAKGLFFSGIRSSHILRRP